MKKLQKMMTWPLAVLMVMALSACEMDDGEDNLSVESEVDINSISEMEQALSAGLSYGSCNDILAGGVFNVYLNDQDYEAAGLLKRWACSSEEAEIESNIGVGIFEIGASADNYVDWKKANCEGSEVYHDESFSYYAISKIADQGIIDAWLECMQLSKYDFSCTPEKLGDRVVIVIKWDNIYSDPELDASWTLQGIKVEPKPETVNFGFTRVALELADEDKTGLFVLNARGVLPSHTFTVSCAYNLDPKPKPLYPISPLLRYWNPTIGDHFYTTDRGELGNGGWGYSLQNTEGHLHQTSAPDTVPLYRFWNRVAGDHFYTTDLNEPAGDYILEGIQGYVYQNQVQDTVPLYRYWHPGIRDHFYTTNLQELGNGQWGYALERVACYVKP